jgi:LAO/AO transport system kinase
MMPLAERVLAGDPRAIARAITLIESDDPAARDLIAAIYPRTGKALVVGVTGAPGAGKSTLVDRLTAHLRGRAPASRPTVGIVAVDPTSPFSGGAVLGDRVRMQGHAADEGVFIRSMATRGHLGGLSRATCDAVLVLDAAGKEIIIIETVGVGQDEVEVVGAADISIVTLVPGTGDDVQALKAGIMEIADIFVINKADREGADALVAAVDSTLSLHMPAAGRWTPPIVKTVATTGTGIRELAAAIDRFVAAQSDGRRVARRRASSEARLRGLVSDQFMTYLEDRVLAKGELSAVADRIAAREVDPYSAAADLIGRALALR